MTQQRTSVQCLCMRSVHDHLPVAITGVPVHILLNNNMTVLGIHGRSSAELGTPSTRALTSSSQGLGGKASCRHDKKMAKKKKKKTTVYIDEDLLRVARVQAASHNLRDSAVFEDALRAYVGEDLIERVWSRSDLSGDEALEYAYAGLKAYRYGRNAPTKQTALRPEC